VVVPSFPRITSRQHDVVKRVRRAARRDDAGVVLLDGEHVLIEALSSGVPIDLVMTARSDDAAAARARAAGAAVYSVTAPVLEAASPVRSPSGIVSLGKWIPATLADVIDRPHALVVGLCGVQDPGNLGGAIRAAHALDATGLLALDDSAHPGGWRALRGAMGSTFRLPVATGTSGAAIDEARRVGARVVAAVADGGLPPDRIDLRRDTLLLLGSEGQGLPESTIRRADDRVTIPMRAGANSLNVAATAALILYEARRQRSPGP
jgi:TrmH family RNA methyltransferase